MNDAASDGASAQPANAQSVIADAPPAAAITVATTPTISAAHARRAPFDFFDPEAGPRARFVAAGLCAGFGLFAAVCLRYGPYWLFIAGALLSYFFGGFRATHQAVRALRERRLEINFLMVLVAVVSAALGHWDEGGILLFLFSLSDALERYALQRTRKSISALMDMRPVQVRVVRGEREFTVPIEELRVGDSFRVRPGERFAADGEVVEGNSAADESIVTGESLPVDKQPGSLIFAGAFNANGSLLVRTTRPASDSTLARIVAMVEVAQENKLGAQRLIERWQTPYVVGVLALSGITMLARSITALLEGDPLASIVPSIQAGMVLLVAASPCAVVLATPVVVLAAVTRGARFGVLFKGGSHLERLATVETIACDKTGTLTRGKPVVTNVRPLGDQTPEQILALAAGLERNSEHPLARAVVRAAEASNVAPVEVTDFAREPGVGVCGRVEGRWVGIGTSDLFARHKIKLPSGLTANAGAVDGSTRVLLWSESGVGGDITLSDEVRPEAYDTLDRLRSLGIRRITLLTGDNVGAARHVAERLGITDVRAALRPEDKLQIIRALAKEGGGVAMLGDGVNDAPALAAATVGIAMGAAGSDVAMETADVVLLRDNLAGVAEAVDLARRSRVVIAQNLGLSLGMIAVLVALTIVGVLWLPVAVICHEGSTVLVVLNGLRMLREPKPSPEC